MFSYNSVILFEVYIAKSKFKETNSIVEKSDKFILALELLFDEGSAKLLQKIKIVFYAYNVAFILLINFVYNIMLLDHKPTMVTSRH